MKSWEKEIRRSATETLYHCDYRYSNDRGTALDMMHDILMNDPAFEKLYDTDQDMASEWMRRYMTGYHHKKTGKYTFTIPEQARYYAIQNYLERNHILTPVTLMNHKGNIEEAKFVASENGYNFADQNLLAGTLRGIFYALVSVGGQIVCHVMIVHLLKGETIFRVRCIRIIEEEVSILDGFAKIGTDSGVVWNNGNIADHIRIDSYSFFQKGRRIQSFSVHINDQNIEFHLAIKPDKILLVHNLLTSIIIE